MYKYLINGDFLCRNLTGIERFAYEILKQLDKIINKNEFSIYIPKNCQNIPKYENIEVIIAKKELKSFWSWCQLNFGFYVKKKKVIGINFSNTCPIISPGYVFLHDIYCKLFPEDFVSFRDKLVKYYSCFMYKFISKHAKKIFTVSNYSKEQIASIYNVNKNKIFVIPNGWDHFKTITEDDSIFNNFPILKNDFYFTLGSISKRKNLKWILDYAKNHPNEHFAISGKILSGLIPEELKEIQHINNIILLGYVSDAQVKTLMKKCKAFIFPSYYEGFGIPPLEAMSVGAKIIISNAASLPEIYGDCGYYINPYDSNINLNDLLCNKVKNYDCILNKYTYENAAKKLYEVLN